VIDLKETFGLASGQGAGAGLKKLADFSENRLDWSGSIFKIVDIWNLNLKILKK
jgi:hypothetical protein